MSIIMESISIFLMREYRPYHDRHSPSGFLIPINTRKGVYSVISFKDSLSFHSRKHEKTYRIDNNGSDFYIER